MCDTVTFFFHRVIQDNETRSTVCRITQFIYYANQGKKCVVCPPLDRMLFRLLVGSGSQVKKKNKNLSARNTIPCLGQVFNLLR